MPRKKGVKAKPVVEEPVKAKKVKEVVVEEEIGIFPAIEPDLDIEMATLKSAAGVLMDKIVVFKADVATLVTDFEALAARANDFNVPNANVACEVRLNVESATDKLDKLINIV